MTKLKICKSLKDYPRAKVSEINDLQGEYKILDEGNEEALLNEIKTYGFNYQLFVWRNPEDNELYALDGHQRRKVILKYFGDVEIPYQEKIIKGNTKKDAIRELLAVSTSFGTKTEYGFNALTFNFTPEEKEAVSFAMEWESADEEVGSVARDGYGELDLSILDEVSDDRVAELREGAKKAIQIAFLPADYNEALILIKSLRERGVYVGGVILEHLKNIK